MNYCTLFDSHYLDKGLTMITSLMQVAPQSYIYVLCMDELCHTILKSMSINNVYLINLNDFEDEELIETKKTRTHGEYCWTCTSKLIKYCILKFALNNCTYLDSDLYFFSNPEILLNKLGTDHCQVQTVSHNFSKTPYGKYLENVYGFNCVQFNSFTNSKLSLELLDKWIDECLNGCNIMTGGDQEYTNSWIAYPFVSVSKNLGAGMAPWNFYRYRFAQDGFAFDRFEKKIYELVFFHFQNLLFLDEKKVRIMTKTEHWKCDKKLFDYVYSIYLRKIVGFRKLLEDKYNLRPHTTLYISREKKTKIREYFKNIKGNKIVGLFYKISLSICFMLRKKQMEYPISYFLNGGDQ